METSNFFSVLQRLKADTTEIWKCAVRKGLISKFVGNDLIMKALLSKLKDSEEAIISILRQLLSLEGNAASSKYIYACLLIVAPDFFIKKSKARNYLDKETESFLASYYRRILKAVGTHKRGNRIESDLLLLLPNFSFGAQMLTKFWEEFERRVAILEGYKERDCIREGCWNYFDILSTLAKTFVVWEHTVMQKANEFGLEAYTKEKDLIKRLLIENFEKRQKIFRNDLLGIVDSYTQSKRELSKETIEK